MRRIAFVALALASGSALAATYQVGPTRPRTTLNQLFAQVNLQPGDIVEVDFATYAGGIVMSGIDDGGDDEGGPGNPVIIRGIRNGVGQRPQLVGGTNTIEFRLADHVVFEGFDVSGTGNSATGTFRCIYHHSNDVVIRDVYVHDCPRHGILGADNDSGSLTIEYSEIYNAGSNGGNHAIYMATDEATFPGSVFRLQYSWVHDSRFDDTIDGGNLIKSRAERNEIYYNWLEGAFFHELELIGPDPSGGVPENQAREDSDVVGNVIVHTADFGAVVRFGGDATGQTFGRYRFVNNTVIRRNANNDTPTMFRLFDGIESLEFHNNVIWREGTGSWTLARAVEADWATGVAKITGTNNWVDNVVFNPSNLANTVTGTITGSDPQFTNLATYNLIPAAGSPLLNAANGAPSSPAGYEIANPLFPPAREPAVRTVLPIGTAALRPVNGLLDIGAYERANSDVLFANGFE
ncbi:MAG TPA: hypothetical protein VFL14_05350 [Xanthomonadales bacterium]|nr:hypothetical protein [Xanthomonadales bacterium]